MTSTGKKRQLIEIEDKYDLMFEQIIANNKGRGEGIRTKAAYLEHWIKQEWLSGDVAKWKLELNGETYYFVLEENVTKTKALIKEYQNKGLELDDQLIQFVITANNGFTLQ